jgi:hypothetical protein
MKTYILINSTIKILSPDDIQVNDIYGIYQKKEKALYEANIANKVIKYNIYEIDLNSNTITNIIKYKNKTFLDSNNKIYSLDFVSLQKEFNF